MAEILLKFIPADLESGDILNKGVGRRYHGLAYVRTRQRQRCAVEHRTGSSCRSTQSVAQYSAVLVRLLEEIVTKLLII